MLLALQDLPTAPVPLESIDQAAPDLLKRVIPDVERWCERYHREHDTRYAWGVPEARPGLSPRQALLWALEDNIDTPLEVDSARTAASILIRHVEEPDGMMDSGMNQSPYVERVGPSMSYFGANDAGTHAFRHYYVTSSMLPPIWRPKGIAPYRAGLYAQLAAGALRTGHPYWGYRFLAWSIHYIQDVTQPWHTIFLPGPLFLQLTKSGMKHEISSLHYLTEAFVDSWMLQAMPRPVPVVYHEYVKQTDDPWFVCRLTEDFASQAHARAEEAAELSRTLFSPVERALDANYKPRSPSLRYGGITFATRSLDFATDGAAKFLQPIWSPEFALASTRDRYLRLLAGQIDAAVEGSRDIVAYVLSGLKASRVGGEHL